MITNLEELDIENLVKDPTRALEYRDAALAVRCAIKGRPENRARKEGAMTSGAVLRRFCLMMKKYDEQYSDKPMKRFIMANEHDIHRIEKTAL